jgi:ketosteroid isomerase-like protein
MLDLIRSHRLHGGMSKNEHAIVAMERAALARWCSGDPSGFLEISAPDVVYFDPFAQARVDGLDALTALYESFRGQGSTGSFELLNPLVQECGDAAVLTFNYVSLSDGKQSRWNCTEVYRRAADSWRIIQTHWSMTGIGCA